MELTASQVIPRQGQSAKVSTDPWICPFRHINCSTRLDVGLRDDPASEKDEVPSHTEHEEHNIIQSVMNGRKGRDQEGKEQSEPTVGTAPPHTVTSLPFCISFPALITIWNYSLCWSLPCVLSNTSFDCIFSWNIPDIRLSRQNKLVNSHVLTSLLLAQSIHDSLISSIPHWSSASCTVWSKSKISRL